MTAAAIALAGATLLLAATPRGMADVPLTSIEAIQALGHPATPQRVAVRLEGILTARDSGGRWYLQQQGRGVLLAATDALAPLAGGTRVAVEGFVESDSHSVWVRPARVDVLGSAPLPEARPTSPDELKDPVLHGTRVQIEGLVIVAYPVGGAPSPDQTEALVVMGTAESPLALRVQARSPRVDVKSLQGMRIRATGVVHPIANPRGQVISAAILVTPADAIEAPGQGSHPGEAPPRVGIDDLLRPGRLAARTNSLRIRGIVTAVLSPHSLFLQDAGAGILVRSIFPSSAQPGDTLEADGVPKVEVIVSQQSGREMSPITFEAHSLRPRGRDGLPKGSQVHPESLNHAGINFRRITVEGRVLSVGRLGVSRDFRLSVQCGDTLMDVLGTDPGAATILPRVRSRARVTGVLDQRAQADTSYQPLRLHLAEASDVVEVAPPPRDLAAVLGWTALGTTALGLLALSWAFTLRRGVRRRTVELAEANASLAVANRARADFLAHMSHEVRTPVHAMNGLLQLLARHPLADEPRSLVRRLATAGRSLTGLVNDVLDFSKIDAGQLVLDPQPFHPNAVLEHLEALFGPAAREKGLAWEIEPLPDGPGPLLVGDVFRLQQVLTNLASNAIKFTHSGHVRVRARVDPGASGRAGLSRLVVEVEDTGTGMDAETVARLFQPYSQANPSIQRTFGGTGLGLAICRRLIDLMGGRMAVESVPGRGTCFRVELDLPGHVDAVGAVPATGEHEPASWRPAGRRLEGCRVLVADDHPLNLGIVEAAIEQEGGCTLLVSDGLQAVEALQHDPAGFDAVLMDLEMPVLGGLEAIRRIRAMPGLHPLPIVASSAGLRADQRKASMASGASSFVPKPFDLDDIVRALVEVIQPGPLPHHGADEAEAATVAGGGAESRDMGPLPEIAGVEAGEAGRRFAGNRPLFLRSLGRFQGEFGAFLARLRADVEAGRAADAAGRLHGLRGAAAMLGAAELAGAAAEMEALCRREGGVPMPGWDQFGRLATELGRLLASIGSLNPEVGSPLSTGP